MKIGKYPVLLACVVIVAAMLACSSFSLSSTPTVSNIRMATDDTGKTPTSTYAPSAAFYVFADLSGLSTGQTIQAKWYAVNAQGVAANTALNTSEYKYQQNVSYVYFQLTTSDGSDWPTGNYRVDVYLDGAKVGEQAFTVQ